MITNLSDQLLRDEGLKLYPYRDTVGKLTIGIGRNLDDDGISLDEADLMRSNDIKRATVALESTYPWSMGLDDARKGAMLNLAFNMGIHKLSGFVKFLQAMRMNDWATAKAELLNSAADHEEPERIARLANQILTAVWQ
jgi:lysozyme